MKLSNQQKSYIYALLAVLCWSTVATSFKISLQSLDIYQMVLICIFTTIVFYSIYIIAARSVKDILTQNKKNLLSSAILGFFNPFLYYIILFKAYSLLKAQVAQPLNMIWPIVLVFMSAIFLKQKLKGRNIISLFVAFIGVTLIASQGNLSFSEKPNLLGIILATGSSLIWSAFWIINLKDKRSDIAKLYTNFLFSAIYLLILMPFLSNYRIELNKSFFAAIYSGMFEMGLAFLFWLKALSLAKRSDDISILIYIAPFLSLFFISLFLKEEIYITTILGTISIILGILIGQVKKNKSQI